MTFFDAFSPSCVTVVEYLYALKYEMIKIKAQGLSNKTFSSRKNVIPPVDFFVQIWNPFDYNKQLIQLTTIILTSGNCVE